MKFRWFLPPALSLLMPLVGQEPMRPKAVLEVGSRYLSPGFEVFVTNAGRVLAFSKTSGDPSTDWLAIWDGTTGSLLRTTLKPLDEDTTYGAGCGGSDGIEHQATLHSNLTPTRWNPTTQRFRFPSREGEAPQELDETGVVAPADPSDPPSAQVESIGPNALRILPPHGDPWVASLPMPLGADQTAKSPIQRALLGRLGFQDVLADREGRWIVATWEGSTPSQAPNRFAVPFKRDRAPRWLMFEPGSPLPVMNVPLGAILGGPASRLKFSLNFRGDRVLVQTHSRVVVLDPTTRKVLVNREGTLLAELPERNQILLKDPEKGPLTWVNLEGGTTAGSLVIPKSLDPAQGPEIRPLGSPVAFSPNGRYMVTPRWGRQGFHWDGLVLWDLDGATRAR